jgi:hypothetical protein
MDRSLVGLLTGLVLLGAAILPVAWLLPYAGTARALQLFEQEDPTEEVAGSAQQGAGLLGLDVVTLDDGRTMEVYRQGAPQAQFPRPIYLVGEHGARLADEPAPVGVWRPFAVRAVLGGLLALLAVVAGIVLVVRSLSGAGFAVFGQRDPDSRPVVWVPGGGGHGAAGGQVPPIVPYDPDWDDPDRRIR